MSDLHELKALLLEAKTESDQLRAERDEVGLVPAARACLFVVAGVEGAAVSATAAVVAVVQNACWQLAVLSSPQS